MNDLTKPKLVAETDAWGKVTHVWLSMPEWKFARPLGATRLSAATLAACETHGAPRPAIAEWVQRHDLQA